jgi:hypothetical protein
VEIHSNKIKKFTPAVASGGLELLSKRSGAYLLFHVVQGFLAP